MSLFNALPSLEQQVLYLTPNQRMATFLRHQYTLNTDKVVDISLIQPIHQWFDELWCYHEECHQEALPLLLSTEQAITLWKQLLEQSDETHSFLSLDSTARLAHDTYELIAQWSLGKDSLQSHATQDTNTYLQWHEQFVQLCHDKNYITAGMRLPYLARLPLPNDTLCPKKIHLLSFDTLTPQVTQWFNHLESQGKEIIQTSIELTPAKQERMSFEHVDAELSHMLDWAVERAATSESIGCIVPNLTQHRQQISKGLLERMGANDFTKHVNISGGERLINLPVIHCAINLLKAMVDHQLSSPLLSQILRSPFIDGAAEEKHLRAKLDLLLRHEQYYHLSLKELAILATSEELDAHCIQLKNLCLSLTPFHSSTQQSPSAWAKSFAQALAQWGWPGQLALNSAEYQTVMRWQSLLSAMGALDLTLPSLSAKDALELVISSAKETLFQIQTPQGKLQVLGLLEGAGRLFDEVWIMGLDAKSWPSPPRPNPFIPIGLQRQHQMPHSSAEKELSFAKSMMERYRKTCRHITYSCGLQDGEVPLLPSPLISHIQQTEIANKHATDTPPGNKTVLETFEDWQAPPIDDPAKVRGGTGLLKAMANCPFQAFGEFRLTTDTLTTPEFGINALERGLLTHHALEVIWTELKSSKKLHAYPTDALEALIEQSLQAALNETFTPIRAKHLNETIFLEKLRLTQILKEWLELEKNRPPFTVLYIEKWQKGWLAGMPLNMRIDRIDKLHNGDNLIIDYKTGRSSTYQLIGERMDAPQLPIYALTASIPVDGIAFAQLRFNDLAFKGISKHATGLGGILPVEKFGKNMVLNNWPSLTKHWSYHIEGLAQAYLTGQAEPDPKSGSTCQYCGLQELCRINELT